MMTSDATTQNPFLTAIPTLVVGTSMLIFLIVSFSLYKRRLLLKRKRDTEYMRYYLYTHPGVSQEEYEAHGIPLRNNVTVMTNTHFADINELLIIDRPEYDKVERQNGKLKLKRKKYGKRLMCKQTQDNAKSSNKSETIADTQTVKNYIFNENIPDRDEMKNTQDNGQNQRKRSKKRKGKFLKLLAGKGSSLLKDVGSKDKITGLVEIRHTEKDSDITAKHNRAKSKHGSGADMNPFVGADSAYQASYALENVYYEEIGLPVSRTKGSRNKRIRKAETIQETGNVLKLSKPDTVKQNAFYDRMTFIQEPKKRYKELVHRDSRGNISLQCRSLPHLDTDFDDTVLFKDNKALEKNLVSNPETLDHLHEYDILF